MGEGEKISELYQQMVRENGDEVLLNTEFCVLWKLEHKNCFGCKSEIGCSKAVALLGIALTPMIYQPKDYEDFEKMQSSISEKTERILKAKTRQEVLNVRW